VSFETAQDVFGKLAKRGKSWKRLRHMVDLAVDDDKKQWGSIADVGTDHGLVAIALALSRNFERVIGVDVSENALRNGALKLQHEVLSHAPQVTCIASPPRLEFRQRDGLQALRPGEADTLCIAGMGVYSMIDILTLPSPIEKSNKVLLDDLRSQRLILQPTNSRPRNLMQLYYALGNMGWKVRDERIEKVSSRWYLSVAFKRRADVRSSYDGQLPGVHLCCVGAADADRWNISRDWVSHHCSWIRQDMKKTNDIHEGDIRWLKAFESLYT
jgi:tRNA A22 N-methylase